MFQASADQDGEFSDCLRAAHDFLRVTQVSEHVCHVICHVIAIASLQVSDNPTNYKKYYRHMNKV